MLHNIKMNTEVYRYAYSRIATASLVQSRCYCISSLNTPVNPTCTRNVNETR